ncbi:hypothetical protein [Shewanella mangrovi]|nr:hypothetical protein [Shewanella mangrovi]
MYIVSLHYLTEHSEVDKFLVAHREYLDTHYQKGHFIASGGKVP